MNDISPFWPYGAYRQGISRVKSIDQFPIYELGAALQQFKDVAKNDKARPLDQFFAVMDAEMHLRKLIQGGQFEIGFCREAAVGLQQGLQRLAEEFRGSDGNMNVPDEPLPQWNLTILTSSIETFEHQLSAELKNLGTYIVPERGIFDTQRLVDRADNHIHQDVRQFVSKFARAEFRKAGRCLAFGLFSASGFHSARAVESVLRDFYAIYMGGPPKKDDAGLGLMASHLEELSKKKPKPQKLPSENTVRYLRDFSKLDRNPLIHPNEEIDLDEMDAYTIFNSALGVIVEMAKALRDESPASLAPKNALMDVPFVPEQET